MKSLLWALETTRQQTGCNKILNSCHRRMVRNMMQLKRRPMPKTNDNSPAELEPWLDYHVRSFQRAKAEIRQHAAEAHAVLIYNRKTWAGHVARFGTGMREQHLCKLVCAWRSRHWLNYQEICNHLNWDTYKHASRGRPRRWETHLPPDWLSVNVLSAAASN